MTNEDQKAQKAVEAQPKKKAPKAPEHPAPGPHAKDHLIDETKTPGSGALPDAKEGNVDPGSG
ncbi:hypothetical protein HGP17_26605 [Rhizobium sp. P38BS-XIX]|uniref:hypothetical protein n=1 Tax=Rhizobium sp. P38BS-XIX TaxID=2726740 RepID=UPI001456C203|nr:hypothetical protein [Rhizobium sp. P38BS-XIX]NLS00415.1 hypothetical protein [Rhizobium sp. P38BS-XIX]